MALPWFSTFHASSDDFKAYKASSFKAYKASSFKAYKASSFKAYIKRQALRRIKRQALRRIKRQANENQTQFCLTLLTSPMHCDANRICRVPMVEVTYSMCDQDSLSKCAD